MKTLVDDAATAVDHAMPPHDEDFGPGVESEWSRSVARERRRPTPPPWLPLRPPWRATLRSAERL